MRDFPTVKTKTYRHIAALVVFSLLILPACLGGGGDDETVNPPSGSVIPPPVGNEPDPGVADIRGEFLAAVNQARSATRMCGSAPYGPAPPVSWSDPLAMAAYLHSEDMALNNFFSHTGSDGSSAGVRR